jgi:hypothetical protein
MLSTLLDRGPDCGASSLSMVLEVQNEVGSL